MGANRKGVCQVCRHPERARIEDMRAQGVSFDALVEKFGIARTVLWRHWHEHVSDERKLSFLVGKSTLDEMREQAAEENLSVLAYLGIMRSVLLGQLVSQAEAGSPNGSAVVSGRLLDVLREIGRITGEIARADPSVTITNNLAIVQAPGFGDLQAGLLRIAREHPAARADIVALLRGLDPASPARPAPLLIEQESAHV